MRFTALILAFAFICLATSQDFISGNWRKQNVEEFMQDSLYQEMLEFGLKQFGTEAFHDHQLGYSEVGLFTVNSIATQVVNGLRIRYNVECYDLEGVVHNADIVVYRSTAGEKEFQYYSLYY